MRNSSKWTTVKIAAMAAALFLAVPSTGQESIAGYVIECNNHVNSWTHELYRADMFCQVRPITDWTMRETITLTREHRKIWTAKAEVVSGDQLAAGTIITIEFPVYIEYSRDKAPVTHLPLSLQTDRMYLLWGLQHDGTHDTESSYWRDWPIQNVDSPVIAAHTLAADIPYALVEGEVGTYEHWFNQLVYVVERANTEQRRVIARALDGLGLHLGGDLERDTWIMPSLRWAGNEPMQWLSDDWFPRWRAAVAPLPALQRAYFLEFALNLNILAAVPPCVDALYEARHDPNAFHGRWGGALQNDAEFNQAKLREIALAAASPNMRILALQQINPIDNELRRKLLRSTLGGTQELKRRVFAAIQTGFTWPEKGREVMPSMMIKSEFGEHWYIANEAELRAWWSQHLQEPPSN